jgi:hypothetical protein
MAKCNRSQRFKSSVHRTYRHFLRITAAFAGGDVLGGMCGFSNIRLELVSQFFGFPLCDVRIKKLNCFCFRLREGNWSKVSQLMMCFVHTLNRTSRQL